MKQNELVTLAILGVGGFALYWYLTSYGPAGPIATAGGASWWTTWFGGAAAPVQAPTQATAAQIAAATATAPAQVTAPAQTQTNQTITTPPPAQAPQTTTALIIPTNLTVSPNINNSLSGTVTVNGVPTFLTIITGNAGQTSGVIWDTNGQDITSQFSPSQQSSLVAAFINASPVGQMATQQLQALNLLPSQLGTGVAGVGMITPQSPFVSPAGNYVRGLPMNPGNGLGTLRGLGASFPKKRWGSGRIPTSGYVN